MDNDNLEDKTQGNANSAGESSQPNPDPIIQGSDESSKSRQRKQYPESVPIIKRSIPAANATLLPDRFVGTRGPVQATPLTKDIIESLLRFKWMGLIVFALVAIPTIAAIWTQIIPKYRARAEVRIRPIIPRLVFRTEDSGPIPFYQSFLNTQVSLIRSLTVLQRVLDQQDVQQTRWYKNPVRSRIQRMREGTAPALERLRNSLSVQPRRGTEIIDVSFTDPSAKDAKVIVNAVLDQYIRYVGERSNATEDELYRQLVDQYKSLENEILGREKVAAELRRSLGTQIPQELISSQRIRIDQTQARLNQLRQRIEVLEWETKQAGTDDSNDLPVAPDGRMENQPKYYEDGEWRQRDVDVRTIRHQIANSLLTPNNPNRVQMEKNLEFAQELLRLREAQLDEQWLNRSKNTTGAPITITGTNGPNYKVEVGLTSPEHELAQAKQEEQLLLAEFEKQKAEFDELFQSAQLLDKENNALLHKRGLFDAVRQRLDQKNMERNVPGSIEVLTEAFASSRPDNDRRIVFTAMALVVSLGMGGGAAFLRASRSQTIYAPKDIPQPMQVPFLGQIPLIHTRKPPGRLLLDEMEKNQSILIESVRVLRTALLSRLDGQGSTTILITSAMAGTGKSSFTLVLGRSIAQVGKKVLMIDADVQKMTLSKWFDLLDKPGFMNSMSSRSINKRNIHRTETPGLSIMPAGKRGDDSVVFEEVANGAFKVCMDRLSKQYDIMLLDSPPILPVADATILASQVDGTIIVEREHLSQRANVASAIARLDSIGGSLLGMVFVGSGGLENYRYSYGYHHYHSGTKES
jgi:capsular exopolysaccharide synthesis family protein